MNIAFFFSLSLFVAAHEEVFLTSFVVILKTALLVPPLPTAHIGLYLLSPSHASDWPITKQVGSSTEKLDLS
jgi:hypothetical protein